MALPGAPHRPSPRIWAIDLTVCAATGAVLGLIGPFGSYFNDPLLARIAYWTGSFVVIALIISLAMRAVSPFARRLQIPMWAWLPALVVVVNAPVSLISRAVAIAIWPALERNVAPLEWYGQSLLVTLIASSVYAAFRLREPVVKADGVAPPAPAFLDRLPARARQDLVCLQMEDHYVRAHLSEGSVLVLMPLKQAIAELEGAEGLQVHRSWWVARKAVTAVLRDSRNLRLKLSNGVEAPVARANVARLRAAGWING